MSQTDTEAGPVGMPRKRTRNPKRKRPFDIPDSEEPDEPLTGPGNDEQE